MAGSRREDDFHAAMQAEGVRRLGRPAKPASPRLRASEAPPIHAPSAVVSAPVAAGPSAEAVAALHAERDAARAERDAALAERDVALAELAAEVARVQALDSERRTLQRRCAQLEAQVAAVTAPPPEPPAADLPEDEPADLAAIDGSATDAAWALFVGACERAGHRRVLIVGGSPAYHKALRERQSRGGPGLRLVPGDARRTLSQARRDESGADLLIIWGGTILDHSTSEQYGRGELPPLRIAHRGIVRMLAKAAAAVQQGLPRR